MVRETQEEKEGGGSSKRDVGIGENYPTMLIIPLSQRSQEWERILVWIPYLSPPPSLSNLKEKTPGAQFLKNSTIVERLEIQNQQALETFRAKNFENPKNKFKAEVVGLVVF